MLVGFVSDLFCGLRHNAYITISSGTNKRKIDSERVKMSQNWEEKNKKQKIKEEIKINNKRDNHY